MIEYVVLGPPDEDEEEFILAQERNTLCGIVDGRLDNLVKLKDLPDLIPGDLPTIPENLPWEIKEKILKMVINYCMENCYYSSVRHLAKSCNRILDYIYHMFYPKKSGFECPVEKLKAIYSTLRLVSEIISYTAKDANYHVDKFRVFLMETPHMVAYPFECRQSSTDFLVEKEKLELPDQDNFMIVHAGPDCGHTALLTGVADDAFRIIDQSNRVNIYRCDNLYFPVILLAVARSRSFLVYDKSWIAIEKHLCAVFKKLGGSPLILFRDRRRNYRPLNTFYY